MVFIFTALFPEAKPIIRALGLKKRTDRSRFQQFVPASFLDAMRTSGNASTPGANDSVKSMASDIATSLGAASASCVNVSAATQRPEIVLTITGDGPIAAAAAVSATLTEYDAGAADQLLSFGTAAMLHVTYIDDVTGRTCFSQEPSESQPKAHEFKAKTHEFESKSSESLAIKPETDGEFRGTDDGTEGASNTDIFLINKIFDQNVDRTFYPDMLIKSDIHEASVVTGSTVLTDRARAFMDVAAADYDLYDMEAAAVYQAGAFFVGPHQMSFMRVVTDHGINEDGYDLGAMAGMVTACVDKNVDKVVDFVDKIVDKSLEDEKKSNVLGPEDNLMVDKVIEDAHFSRVMQDQLRQYVKYAILSGIDWRSTVEELYRGGALPTRDKRSGKRVLDAIRNSITE